MIRRILYNLVPALVPFAILALAGAKIVAQRSAWTKQQVREVVRAELATRTERQVRVGPVEGDLLRGITLRDVAIAEPEGFDAGETLAVEEIRIRYNLIKLVRGEVGPLTSIRELAIVRPTIRATRGRDGKIDVAEMFAPEKPRPPTPDRIMVPVTVSGAKLVYTDLTLPTRTGRPLTIRLEDVSGTVDMSRQGWMDVSLRGVSADGLAREVRADVKYCTSPSSFSVTAQIDGAALERLAELLPAQLPVGVAGGTADVRGVLYGRQGEDGRWETGYNLGVKVAKALVTIPQADGQRVLLSGRMRLTPDTLVIADVKATAPPGRATASGTVFNLLGEPYIDVQVRAEGIDPGAALAYVELPGSAPAFAVQGTATADFTITGPVPHVRLKGTVRLPGGGRVSDERWGLGELVVGAVRATVEVEDITQPRVLVDVTLSGLSTQTDSGTVWEAVPVQLGAIRADAVRAALTWSQAAGVEVTGAIEELQAPAATLSDGHCKFKATGRRVSFDAIAGLLGGTATVQGTYEASPTAGDEKQGAETTGALRVTGRLADVDATAIATLPWREGQELDAEGTAVRRSPDEQSPTRPGPALDEDAVGEEGGGYREVLESVQAGRATVDFALTYDGTSATCRLVANTDGLEYEDERLPDAELAATVSAQNGEGEAGWTVAEGQFSLHAQDNRGEAWVSGQLGPTPEGRSGIDQAIPVRVAFSGLRIDVPAVAISLGQKDVAGIGRIGGRARGTWDQGANEWQLEDSSVAVHIEAPQYQEYAVDLVELELGGDLDDLQVRRCHAVRGDSEVTVAGSIRKLDFEKKDAQLALHATTRDSSVADWLAVAGLEYEVTGTCSVDADIDGSVASPRVAGHVRVADVIAYDEPIDVADGRFEYADDTVRLTDLSAESEGAVLQGECTIAEIGKARRLSGTFETTGVSISRVPAIAEAELPVRAVFGGRGDISGTVAEPVISASVRADDVSIAGHPLWNLRATVAYTGEKVSLQRATWRGLGGAMEASGTYQIEDGGLELDASIDAGRTWLLAETAAALVGEREADTGALRRIGERLHAQLGGTITLRGSPEQLTGKAQFTFTRATLDKLHIPDVKVMCSFVRETTPNARVFRATISEVDVREGDMRLTVAGDIEASQTSAEPPSPPEEEPVQIAWLPSWPAGIIGAAEPDDAADAEPTVVTADLRASARNVDLKWLARWLPFDPGLRGSMDFDATFRGSVDEPSIAVTDFRIDTPGVYELTLDRISMKSFEVAPGRAEVRRLALAVGGQEVQFSGRLPFVWEPLPVPEAPRGPLQRSKWLSQHVPAEQPISLEATLQHIDPRIFPPLIDGALAAAGRLAAEQQGDDEPARTSAVPATSDSRALAERLELGGDIDGSLVIEGTVEQPLIRAAGFRLNEVRIGVPDGPSIAEGMRGAIAFQVGAGGKPSRIALDGFSADLRGVRVLAAGHVETSRLLSDGIAVVPQQLTVRLLGPWVIIGDPWAGARVLTALPRRWHYRRDPEALGTEQKWFGGGLDDGDWEQVPAGDGRPEVQNGEVIWYRTRFTAPRAAAGKLLALAFESMRNRAELYVNGQFAGRYVPPMPVAEPSATGELEQPGVQPPDEESPLAQRWAVEVTDLVAPGRDNLVALRLIARRGPLPHPGPARLGEVRGLVVRNIAGVITAERTIHGDPLDVRVGGVPSEGIDAGHVSAEIGRGTVRLWGGIEVATDKFSLARLAENKVDLTLAIDDITPRYPPYFLNGRIVQERPITLRGSGNGDSAWVRGRWRVDYARVSLPVGGGGGGESGGPMSAPARFPQPVFDLAIDIGRHVNFVTPPLYLSSISGNGGGIPLAINAPLPLRETRDAFVLKGTPHDPSLKLDAEVARNVQFAPPGGGQISIRRTAVGFELGRAQGAQEQDRLPLVGRILAYIEGVRKINGGSFSFVLVSPDYVHAHPEVLHDYEDVLRPPEGRATPGGEEEAGEDWILACRPASIGDRGTRELLLLAFWPFGRVAREGGVDTGEVALTWATERAVARLDKQILRPIEDLLVESGLVDQVTIQGVLAGAPSFQVGKDIIDNLYITYQRQLTARREEGLQEPYTFTAAYRVNDKYDITFTTDERRTQRIGVEYRVPF